VQAASLGLTVVKTSEFTETETIKQANHTLSEFRSDFGAGFSRRDLKIRRNIKLAYDAYITDGLIKQTVDKYVEMFMDFDFEGEKKPKDYLMKRLNTMSLQTGEPYKVLLSRAVTEYFLTGNMVILKYRGWNNKSTNRALYVNKPYSISGLELFSITKMDTHFNKDSVFDGWQVRNCGVVTKIDLLNPRGNRLSTDQCLIDVSPKVSDDDVLLPGVDLLHISYKKLADTKYGYGLILAGLEDFALIRKLELTTAIMWQKFSMPLFHHTIERTATPLQGQQNDIVAAYAMHQRKSPDGFIVTGANHKITAIGAESQAMRVEGYLKYFSSRACSSIGISTYLLGLESGTLGTVQTATENLNDKVRWCMKDISWQMQPLINEILWEGGFDPYTNPEKESVKLVFEDIDVDRTIKAEAHATDMFTKNAIDHDQLQAKLKNKKGVNDSRLYSNMIDKPKIDHEAAAKIRVEKSKPKPRTVREQVEKILPRDEGDLEDFIFLMTRRYGYSQEQFQEISHTMIELVNDEDAFIELIVQLLADEE